MAIESKLIRVRRGTAAEFEAGKSKIISGEFAVVTDTEEAYFSPQDEKSVRLATEKDVSQLEESIIKMGNGSGLTPDLKTALQTYFTNIQTLITQMAFTTDAHIGGTLISNAQSIVTALESSGSTEQPESGIFQTGSILAIASGVTATQTGSVLAIA